MAFPWLRFVAAAPVAAAVMALARPASAEEAAAPYTPQVVVADLSSVAVLGGGFAYSKGDHAAGVKIGVVGMLGYTFVTPVVHLLHRRPLEALVSFGLRLALPLGIIGLTNTHTPGRVALFAAAMAAPSVIDAAVLSRPTPPAAPARPQSVSVSPYFGGTEAGVAGAF